MPDLNITLINLFFSPHSDSGIFALLLNKIVFNLTEVFNSVILRVSGYITIPIEILAIYVIILIFAIPIAYLFFLVLYFFYQIISYTGKYRGNNFWQIFGCNIVLTIPIYLTIWTILQPKDNEIFAFFFSSLIIIIAFLLSLRFLSVPTKRGFIKLFEVWENTAIPDKAKAKIGLFRDNVIAFYFSIIAVSIFYVIIFWIFDLLKPIFSNSQSASCNCTSNPIWETPLPPIPLVDILIFISGYILALFIGTKMLEYYLERSIPIDDLE
jgi:hypothetical protein